MQHVISHYKNWKTNKLSTAHQNSTLNAISMSSTCCMAPYSLWYKGQSIWRIACNYTWLDNKVRELIAVKVLHTSLLNTTVVAFKVLPLGSQTPMPTPSPPFKTILKLVLWNGLQSCRCITPDVIDIIKIPSFQSSGTGKSHWGLDPVNRQGVPTQLFVQ